MAGCTGLECQANPSGLLVGTFHVALRALDFDVLSGQGIFRLCVIEVCDGLPIRSGMALLALFSESTLMLISVTGGALSRDAKERAIEILYPDCQLVSNGDVARIVALVTGDCGVFALERPASFGVIELL